MKNLVQALLSACVFMLSTSIYAQSFSVDNGYVREVIPGNTVTSAYMVINNDLAQDVSLIGASSDVSPRIEIHAHSMEGGMMKMRQLAEIQIKANKSVILQPMGFHLMIFDVAKPLKAGDKVKLTLEFSNDQQLDITVPVQSIKKQKKQHHHH